ncbi:NAD(P)-binding domain-containing protein [Streptomyces sp900116325]|uniref:NAD(P)-binding domain-containing protein n=1 Tax=Streptomyces sp. 900116325 TaxID=3154295 RepID=A0ABV2UMW9_9ACTN
MILSNSRGRCTLRGAVAELGPGASAASAQEAAGAEVVLLAVPWRSVIRLLDVLPPWGGQTLVDATNAVIRYTPEKTEAVDFGSRTSNQVVAAVAATARVVKAFSTLPFRSLQGPRVDDGRRVIVLSGDQADSPMTSRTRCSASLQWAALALCGLRLLRNLQLAGDVQCLPPGNSPERAGGMSGAGKFACRS